MDNTWAIGKLERYLATCEQLRQVQKAMPDLRWTDECDVINREAELQLSTVQRIVAIVAPEYSGLLAPPSRIQNETERFVRQALGALIDAEEVEEMLRPSAPSLLADRFHPLVWDAASTIWHTGLYRTAVGQAVVTLNAEIKSRAGSTLNDFSLVAQVFSPNPPRQDQQVRLQLPGDPSENTWKSRQQGLQMLAQGAFAGIRNVAAHTDAEWSEHEALEHLAVLSVIARWLDQTEVVRFTL